MCVGVQEGGGSVKLCVANSHDQSCRMNDLLTTDNANLVYMTKHAVFEMILFIKLMTDPIEHLFILITISLQLI